MEHDTTFEELHHAPLGATVFFIYAGRGVVGEVESIDHVGRVLHLAGGARYTFPSPAVETAPVITAVPVDDVTPVEPEKEEEA